MTQGRLQPPYELLTTLTELKPPTVVATETTSHSWRDANACAATTELAASERRLDGVT
jgi:hypothetical protein